MSIVNTVANESCAQVSTIERSIQITTMCATIVGITTKPHGLFVVEMVSTNTISGAFSNLEDNMAKKCTAEWDDHNCEWYYRIVEDDDSVRYSKYPVNTSKPTYRMGYGCESNWKDW